MRMMMSQQQSVQNEHPPIDNEDDVSPAMMRQRAVASLMPCPRTMFDLWQEYQFGVGGRKPARLFNHSERGAVKFRYCRRKVFWDWVAGQVRLGMTAEAAIDLLLSVYGAQTSVSTILEKLRQDIRNGTLSPTLRI